MINLASVMGQEMAQDNWHKIIGTALRSIFSPVYFIIFMWACDEVCAPPSPPGTIDRVKEGTLGTDRCDGLSCDQLLKVLYSGVLTEVHGCRALEVSDCMTI